MRFLTITCNPAVDTTYVLDELRLGAINRVAHVLPQPGGKGNNVARVLAALGHAPVATGFAGGYTGRFIEEGLRAQRVMPAFVPLAGDSRICLSVVESASGRISEIREPGVAVAADEAGHFLTHVGELAAGADAAVISGSLPPGMPADFYAHLLAVLRRAGILTALDTSGEPLRAGLAGGPDLIKPNLEELSFLLGRAVAGEEAIARAQSELFGPLIAGDAAVLLSMGAEGAALIRQDRAYRTAAPRVEAVNTVGCGDALLAGFLDARARGLGDAEALAQAVAVGTAAALQPSVGAVDPADVARLRREVRVTEEAGSAGAPAYARVR